MNVLRINDPALVQTNPLPTNTFNQSIVSTIYNFAAWTSAFRCFLYSGSLYTSEFYQCVTIGRKICHAASKLLLNTHNAHERWEMTGKFATIVGKPQYVVVKHSCSSSVAHCATCSSLYFGSMEDSNTTASCRPSSLLAWKDKRIATHHASWPKTPSMWIHYIVMQQFAVHHGAYRKAYQGKWQKLDFPAAKAFLTSSDADPMLSRKVLVTKGCSLSNVQSS